MSLTINETIKWLSSVPILMQNRSDGDSVALGIPPPPPRDLGPRQYLPGDNSTRTPVSDGKNAMEGRPGVVGGRWLSVHNLFFANWWMSDSLG